MDISSKKLLAMTKVKFRVFQLFIKIYKLDGKNKQIQLINPKFGENSQNPIPFIIRSQCHWSCKSIPTALQLNKNF